MATANSTDKSHQAAAVAFYEALDFDKVCMAILHQKALLDMMGVYFDAREEDRCDTLPEATLSSYVSQIRDLSNLIDNQVSAASSSGFEARYASATSHACKEVHS